MSETVRLEVFFDCSSPFNYLAFHNIQPLAARHDVPIVWRPVIVGGIFNAVNRRVVEDREDPPIPRKHQYGFKDIQDWARLAGLTIVVPPACGHPVNAVACMRACIVMDRIGKLVPFATAAFEALWADGRNLGEVAVLADLCRRVDADPDAILAEIATQPIKDALRSNTNEAIARGAFGAPTIFVGGDDMYFGNDRLPLVDAALARCAA